jgi:hypothetical protein
VVQYGLALLSMSLWAGEIGKIVGKNTFATMRECVSNNWRNFVSVGSDWWMQCDCDEVLVGNKQVAPICHQEVKGETLSGLRIKAKNVGWSAIKRKEGKKTITLDLCVSHTKMYQDGKTEIAVAEKRQADLVFSQLIIMPEPDAEQMNAVNE